MNDDKPNRWHRLRKVSFTKKDLSKRMRKVESVTVRHARKFIVKRWSSVWEVRRRITFWVVAVGILIAAAGIQLMWYQQGYKTEAASTTGTYAEAVLGPVNTLNPLFANSSAELSASQLLFSRLLTYDNTGHLSHDLVTHITVDDTHTVYTVTIRPDVTWSDGVALTAKDVAFTVGLLKNPSVHSTITGWNDISVKVVNSTTLAFTLPATYAAFEYALTFPIVPEHILGSVAPSDIRGHIFSRNPIGSGPFALSFVQSVDETTDRQVIYMARNSHYYAGMSKLAHFQLHVYGSRTAIVHALATSEVNAAADLSSNDVKSVDLRRYAVSTKPIKSGVYAILNTKSQILSDKAVRQALQLGTDTKAIRERLPAGTPALDLPFIGGQLTGDVPSAPVPNPTEAKKMLTDDGWVLDGATRKKAGVELMLSIITTKDSALSSTLEVLVGEWRALGVGIQTQIVDPSDPSQNVFQDILQPRKFDVLLYQVDIGADPDVFAYWHSSQVNSRNYSGYSNVVSDDALASARARVEPALRNAKYITFAKEWLQDVPAIGLYQSTIQYVYSYNARVYDNSNVFVSPTDRYSDVLQWSVGTRTVYKTP